MFYRRCWRLKIYKVMRSAAAAMIMLSAVAFHGAQASERKTRLDPRVRQRLLSLVAEYCRDPLARSIFMVKTGQAELGPNLAANPGFEEVWGDDRHQVPEGEEWRKGVAHGWGVSPRFYELGGVIDTVKYDEEDPEFGWRSGRIAHINGYYNRAGIGRVYPGNSYYVSACASLHRLSEINLEYMPEATLEVRWWGKGWIHTDRYTVSRTLTEPGKWIELETVVMPAATAEYAVVFLSASNMDKGTEVLFDNLSFRLITEEAE